MMTGGAKSAVAVFVGDVLDEQHEQDVVLVLAGIHAAAQFVAGGPEGGVEVGFLDGHGVTTLPLANPVHHALGCYFPRRCWNQRELSICSARKAPAHVLVAASFWPFRPHQREPVQ